MLTLKFYPFLLPGLLTSSDSNNKRAIQSNYYSIFTVSCLQTVNIKLDLTYNSLPTTTVKSNQIFSDVLPLEAISVC